MVHVLIVDDSAFSQKVTAHLLKEVWPNEDLKISFAANGEDGLREFRTQQPDYIFIDLLMPKMSGADLIRIVQREGNPGIIVVTADVQKSVREEMKAQNIMAFVNKPLNREKMRLLCDRMIRNDKNESGMLSL
ncbi:MAG: Stage 0 sporulation A-like protein [Oscillospiraceae bacterium]|jgi:two-component system, chemotaxis family, chemotaxis protein CheY